MTHCGTAAAVRAAAKPAAGGRAIETRRQELADAELLDLAAEVSFDLATEVPLDELLINT